MPGLPGAFDDLQAIAFDFDGVLIESGGIKTRAFELLFADHPQHLEAIRRHHRRHLGISRYEKFAWIHQHLLGLPLTPERSRRLGERFSELVVEPTVRCPWVPGAPELLAALRGRLPLFVVSGTPQDELRDIVERRGLAPYLDAVWGSPTQKHEILGALARERNVPAGAILMVGDGISDLEAARRVGTRFVARRSEDSPGWERLGVTSVADLFELGALLGLDGR